MSQMEKPEYLELLNAISLGESAAGVYLEAWANATSDEELAACLRLVAARESSHGDVFCRRIGELGFDLEMKADPEAAARIARYANPKISDLDKIGPERVEGAADPVADFFAETKQKVVDGYYDQMTGNLLNWYIAEEKDSGKRLGEVYAKIRERAGMGSKAKAKMNTEMAMAGAPSADAEAIMACMTSGFKSLEKTLEKLAKAR